MCVIYRSTSPVGDVCVGVCWNIAKANVIYIRIENMSLGSRGVVFISKATQFIIASELLWKKKDWATLQYIFYQVHFL